MGILNIITGRNTTGAEREILVNPPKEIGSASLVAAAAMPIITQSLNTQYDTSAGAWNFVRGNTDITLMASSSISATTAISVTNYNSRGVYAFMNITSGFPGSGSTTYTLKIKAIQPNAPNSAQTIAAAPPMSTSGCAVLCIYPGATKATGSNSTSAIANLAVASLPMPRNFQVVASLSSGATSKEVVMSLGLTIIN